MRAPSRYEGLPTCLLASYSAGGRHSVRNSANNSWNVNLNNGNLNNNNTNNRNYCVGSSESCLDADEWFAALRSFYKNKHDSLGAQRLVIHPSRVLRVARRVASGTYRPQPGYRFPITEPSPREIYAAFCEDRLVHHYVAPFISAVAEAVHAANGNVSHGNRVGHSAHTGAEQISGAVSALGNAGEPYIAKVDIASFFASIPRAKACEVLEQYARQYYHGADLEEKLGVCRILILHDPTKGCIELPGNWAAVPARKRMGSLGEGRGLPIGNFYSQLVANLILAELDAALLPFGVCPRFVDDKVIVAKDKRTAIDAVKAAWTAVEALGLTMHPDKLYIQPAHRGVNFCGRTVKGRRVYISNRTLRSAFRRVRECRPGENGARRACASANSYLGLLRHCTERRNEQRLADAVLNKYGSSLYFVIKAGHFICRVKRAFTSRFQHMAAIAALIKRYRRIALCPA